jgi:hypothetical protein
VEKRFTEEQIIGFLREADRGVAVKKLCRKYGFKGGASGATVTPTHDVKLAEDSHQPLPAPWSRSSCRSLRSP